MYINIFVFNIEKNVKKERFGIINKYNEFDEIRLVHTNEKVTIIDFYEVEGKWYYQVELFDKTENRDIIECEEEKLEKIMDTE